MNHTIRERENKHGSGHVGNVQISGGFSQMQPDKTLPVAK